MPNPLFDVLVPRQIPHLFMVTIGASECPAIPLCPAINLIDSLDRLAARQREMGAAIQGLSNKYTIGGTEAMAVQFLIGGLKEGAFGTLRVLLMTDPRSALNILRHHEEGVLATQTIPTSDALTDRPLETASQWSISWTNYAGVYERARSGVLTDFCAALDPADPVAASRRFWPTTAEYGLPYNLLVLQKVKVDQLPALSALFGPAWKEEWSAAAGTSHLYVIDMRLFETVPPDVERERFTPATVTLLRQDPATKNLMPVAVRVTAQGGTGASVFVESSPAWLYGLQAARTSMTVWGIWLGHVYHWHIVSAAMFSALREANGGPGPGHPVRLLLDPQSRFLAEFDEILLLLWRDVAPPTSVATYREFLRLMSRFAGSRDYFMDDPRATLERNGIVEADFSVAAPWDRYPIARTFLEVWDATAAYVGTFVENAYPAGSPPASDPALQAWVKRAADANFGNVPGLPDSVGTNEELTRLLTSLVYRVTMHGSGRLLSSANPGLTFVANFPPCLQSLNIPAPDTAFTPLELFKCLPRTGTIGEMVRFYYTFSFSRPYEPFVPENGVSDQLFFPGGLDFLPNRALVEYRKSIQTLIDRLSPESPPQQSQRYQWPLSIET